MRRFVRGWFLAVAALLMTAGPLWAGPPDSQSETSSANTVSELNVEQKTDGTYLRLTSTQTPSFSVYKLTDPLRLVVDVSGSELDDDRVARDVNNGVVSKVALLETTEDDTSRVRLIVGFVESTHYDVRTDGNDLVIFVEGKPEPKTVRAVRRELERKERKLASLQAELERVRSSYETKLDEAQSRYQQAKSTLEDKSARVTSLREKVADLEGRAERARGEVRAQLTDKLESKRQQLRSVKQTLSNQRKQVDELESRVASLTEQRDSVARQLRETKSELRAERERVDEQSDKLAELRRSQKRWRAKLDKWKRQQKQAESKASQTRRKLERARAELERLKSREREESAASKRNQKLADRLDATRQKVDRLSRQLDQRKGKVSSLKQKVATLERQNDDTEQTLASLRDDLASQRKTAQRRADKLESLRERLEAEQQRSRRRADRLESLKQQKSEWSSTLASKDHQLESTEQQLQQTRSKLDEVQQELDAKDKRVAALQKRLERQREQGDERKALADRLDALKQDVEQQRQRAERLKKARKQKAATLAELRRERNEMKRKLERARAQLDETRDRLAEAKKRNERVAGASKSTAGSRGKDGQRGRSDDRNVARAEPVDTSAEPNTIRDIRLVQRDGESRIVVELERPGEYRRLPWQNQRAVMLLKNVELPERLQNTIAASGDSGAVRFVSSEVEQPGQVRMEADVNKAAEERIKQRGSKLVWEFAPSVAPDNPSRARTGSSNGSAERARAGRQPRRPEKVEQTAAPPGYPTTVIDPSKVNRVPGMANTRMTLDIRNADIQNVLRMFAKQGDVNIITGEGVEGAVTITLEEVPLDRAFLIVLQSQSLGFEVRGSVIRVATQEKLRAEQKARQEAAQRAQKLEPLEVFMMPINYAEASELTDQVKRLLSPRGSVSVDQRTNTLIIKDLRANIRSIRQLVNTLDTQVPQVLIKARIVETNDTFSREFGIQWGGDFTASQGNGNPTGLAFPNVIGVAGGATDAQTNAAGTGSNPNFAVNLPAPAGTGTGGALGMTLGSIGDSVNLNLRLSAAEESGRAKIVSAPKILTLDNREATISQGTSIPISVVSAAGVQTVFVDATLELTVRPHVTPDGHIQLSLTATKNEPDFQNTGARGDPTIIRRSAETELLIEDGDTTVIGGIYTRNSGTSMTGIPFLHKIPILGALFKTTDRSERRSELLIFITPRIVNRADALGNVSAGDVVSPSSGGSNGGGGNSSSGGGSSSNAGGNSGGEIRTRMEP